MFWIILEEFLICFTKKFSNLIIFAKNIAKNI